MNIRDCEYLIALDELGSFAKAANKCFISQPALSQQVKKLEEELGVLIFERSNKQILTTNSGKKIIGCAREIRVQYQKMHLAAKDKQEIKLALIPTICAYLLPKIVGKLTAAYQDAKFFFLEEKTESLLAKLSQGAIDFGIIAYFDNLIDRSLHYQKLYDEEFMLVLPINSALNIGDFAQIVESKELILLEEGNCMSDNIKEICSLYNETRFNDFYATNIETVKNIIRANNGIGILPAFACDDLMDLKVLPFKPKKTREVGVVWRKGYQGQDFADNLSKLFV